METLRAEAASVKSLVIGWAAGSVNVEVVDDGPGDVVEFWETASRELWEGQRLRWRMDGHVLRINYGTWLGGLLLGRKDLEVRIPRTIAASLDEVRIDGSSGCYRVVGVGCDVLSLRLASGKAKAEDVRARNLAVDVASGSVSATGRFDASVKVRAASGKTHVFCAGTCPREVDVDAASGTVRLALPAADGFTARVSKASGTFTTGFAVERQGSSYRYGDGAARIGVRMASGTVALDRVG